MSTVEEMRAFGMRGKCRGVSPGRVDSWADEFEVALADAKFLKDCLLAAEEKNSATEKRIAELEAKQDEIIDRAMKLLTGNCDKHTDISWGAFSAKFGCALCRGERIAELEGQLAERSRADGNQSHS